MRNSCKKGIAEKAVWWKQVFTEIKRFAFFSKIPTGLYMSQKIKAYRVNFSATTTLNKLESNICGSSCQRCDSFW